MFRSSEEEVEYILHAIEECIHGLARENITANRIDVTAGLWDLICASNWNDVISRHKDIITLYGLVVSVVAERPPSRMYAAPAQRMVELEVRNLYQDEADRTLVDPVWTVGPAEPARTYRELVRQAIEDRFAAQYHQQPEQRV